MYIPQYNCFKLGICFFPRELPDKLIAGSCQPDTQFRIMDKRQYILRKRLYIVYRRKQRCLIMFCIHAKPTDIGTA